METPEPMIMTTFRIDVDTYTNLLAFAEVEDRTVSDVIRQAVKSYLAKMS